MYKILYSYFKIICTSYILYFGANTIWYLQFQLVCAKLLLSFILTSFCWFVQLPDRTFHFIWRSFFIHRLSFLNPWLSQGFSEYKKYGIAHRLCRIHKRQRQLRMYWILLLFHYFSESSLPINSQARGT